MIIVIAGIIYALTYPALHQMPFHAALIDAERSASEIDDSSVGTTPDSTETRRQRMQHAFAALGLSDAQKQQIGEIRRTVTDRTERRGAIMDVLTPAQRAKWQEIRQAQRSGTAPDSTAANPSNEP